MWGKGSASGTTTPGGILNQELNRTNYIGTKLDRVVKVLRYRRQAALALSLVLMLMKGLFSNTIS